MSEKAEGLPQGQKKIIKTQITIRYIQKKGRQQQQQKRIRKKEKETHTRRELIKTIIISVSLVRCCCCCLGLSIDHRRRTVRRRLVELDERETTRLCVCVCVSCVTEVTQSSKERKKKKKKRKKSMTSVFLTHCCTQVCVQASKCCLERLIYRVARSGIYQHEKIIVQYTGNCLLVVPPIACSPLHSFGVKSTHARRRSGGFHTTTTLLPLFLSITHQKCTTSTPSG